jgi:glycosyltransferase involved in cell wall biosynthesis
MKVGVAIDESWAFFKEICAELEAYHEVSLFTPREVHAPFFKERIDRLVRKIDLTNFLNGNDVVFFEWASHLLAKASWFPKHSGIVTRLHRYEMYQWVDQINWEAVDKVILVSHAKKAEFQSLKPGLGEKLAVIPEAISIQRFPFSQRQFNGDIGIMCHMSPRKRVYELILAFSELSRSEPNLHLHIGGGPRPMYPDYYTNLQSLADRLGISNHVTFYGPIENAAAWYHAIDIFISNSYSEGLQVSPMEAMASGCYCLSHWWDGADELLPVSNLYFTDQELIEKLVEYIRLPDDEKQLRCGLLRRNVQERFNMDNIKVEIRKLVEATGRSWMEE